MQAETDANSLPEMRVRKLIPLETAVGIIGFSNAIAPESVQAEANLVLVDGSHTEPSKFHRSVPRWVHENKRRFVAGIVSPAETGEAETGIYFKESISAPWRLINRKAGIPRGLWLNDDNSFALCLDNVIEVFSIQGSLLSRSEVPFVIDVALRPVGADAPVLIRHTPRTSEVWVRDTQLHKLAEVSGRISSIVALPKGAYLVGSWYEESSDSCVSEVQWVKDGKQQLLVSFPGYMDPRLSTHNNLAAVCVTRYIVGKVMPRTMRIYDLNDDGRRMVENNAFTFNGMSDVYIDEKDRVWTIGSQQQIERQSLERSH